MRPLTREAAEAKDERCLFCWELKAIVLSDEWQVMGTGANYTLAHAAICKDCCLKAVALITEKQEARS